MHFSLGEWLTTALTFTNGWTVPTGHTWNLATTLTRAASAPNHIGLPSGPASRSPLDRAQPLHHGPITRAQVFAERLAHVRPICVVGSRDDQENCLLDLPADVHLDVSATRLLLAGCEASLPAGLSKALAEDGRNASSLERRFFEAHAAESQGPYAVPALVRRLNKRLNQLMPGWQRLLRRTNAYLQVPQLTFQRVITSEQEARRHGIQVPFTRPDLHLPLGEPVAHDAMLGAYLRIPADGVTHTLFVSLRLPQTLEIIEQTPQAHAAARFTDLFGDIPAHFQTSNLRMRTVAHCDDLVEALAEHLHLGHRRYREFAYGATREALAPTSHSQVRQRLCPRARPLATSPPRPGEPDRATAGPSPSMLKTAKATETAKPAPTSTAPDTMHAPPRRRPSQRDQPSLRELEWAIAELERLDTLYTVQGRPRYG
ncbi:hypothetical protein PCA31118_04178 [Pandoraea captiosa]|uniref:Uncharacterized protein n=1 Tax=Pandoraea captiosa TaxID=2508302 RepID=A0A5E5AFI5_9BURK|nr:hypothetical protein [Pandoraea captiosa]VVE72411.1 hypothetical protein PCA31118_04178 [Pandoraea captiosa]